MEFKTLRSSRSRSQTTITGAVRDVTMPVASTAALPRTVMVVADAGQRRDDLCARLGGAPLVIAAVPAAATAGVIDAFGPELIVLIDPGGTPDELLTVTRRIARLAVLVDDGERGRLWESAARQVGGGSVVVAQAVSELDPLLIEMQGDGRSVIRCFDIVIDEDAHIVRRQGVDLDLTATEYRLLLDLIAHAGRVMSKTQLLERVWSYDSYDPNVVEVHVCALRRKLEACGPRLIHTVRGFGYVLRV